MLIHDMEPTHNAPRTTYFIQCFTGDGKGKTSAALGTMLRAISKGWRVAIVSFDKGGTHYSEREILRERFSDLVDMYPTGLDRIDPETGRFRFGVLPEDRAEAERGLGIARELFAKNVHRLVILDEINSAVALGMLSESAVLDLLRSKPPDLEAIITGRNATPGLVDASDLVTEMKNVKHYLDRGVEAREGLDY
jgi:cob(I)alamin adenosyltransferase